MRQSTGNRLNRKLVIGLILFGIAGVFFAIWGGLFFELSGFYFDDVYRPEGVPCDNCPAAFENLLFYTRLFGVIGGVVASTGAGFVIAGYKHRL